MKQANPCAVAVLVVLAAQFAPVATRAQDSLRVLRFQPDSVASPVAPVVLSFDHPVAPRLDETIDAARVLHITPTVGAHIYWRDPSTIVAEFDSAWTAGSSYDVRVDPKLRSESGLSLASTAPMRVRIQMPRALQVVAFANGVSADTVLRTLALYTSAFDLGALSRHVWFVPQLACANTDSVEVIATGIRNVASTDPYEIQQAGTYDRDRRLDVLRRVVELTTTAPLRRGCKGELHVPLVIGEREVVRVPVAIRMPFRLDSLRCAPVRCEGGGRIELRFTNPVTAAEVRANVRVDGRPARYESDSPAATITLLDSVRPMRSAHVTVSAALRNAAGELVGRDTMVTLTGNKVSPPAPSVGFVSELATIPRDEPTLLRVSHVNTDSIIVVIGRVADAQRTRALTHNESFYFSGPPRWEEIARDTVVRMVASPAPRDSVRIVDLPMSLVPAAWRSDPMLLVRAEPVILFSDPVAPSYGRITIVPRAPPVRNARRFAVVLRSNLAAHALVNEGEAEVWVTSLRDATARAGATVRLFDDSLRLLASGITDKNGRAHLRNSRQSTTRSYIAHLEIVSGDDRTLMPVSRYALQPPAGIRDDSLSYGYWQYMSSRIGARRLHGAAFTDRGIYRPGERVYLAGSARTYTPDEGYRIPTADSARWTVWFQDPRASLDRIWSRAGKLSDFGALSDSFDIGATERLGTYVATLAVRAEGDWRTATSTTFRVAEYRAPEFAVTLHPDTSTTLFGGDSATIRLDARYLFGLPMAAGKVQWWATTSERPAWDLRIPGLEKFTVGRSDWRTDYNTASSVRSDQGSGTLGDDGVMRLRVPTSVLHRPGAVHITATVADASRQAVSAEVDVKLEAANAYLGMRTRERRWLWRERDTVFVELLVVRPDGTVRVGDEITVVAQRSRWINSKLVRDTVWRTTATSAKMPVSVAFAPGVGGDYELIGSVHDESGRRSLTSIDVWMSGQNRWWWWQDNPRVITLRSDRTRYAPGDVASVIVDSPAEQRAWVTVRHEGMMGEQFVDLHRGVNEVRVPIPTNAAAQATIQVIAIRPYGSRAGDDSTGIYYRSGSIEITVDSSSRSLHVVVAPDRQRYQPRDTVRVRVDVRDANGRGRRSEVTVWAVDQGVISLTDFVRPAMLAMLTAGNGDSPWSGSTLLALMLTMPPAPGSVFGSSSYIRIRGVSSGARIPAMMALDQVVAIAGSEGKLGEQVRGHFSTTPFFAGHLRTDADGRVTTTFALPDNVSAFRIYAAAIGDGLLAGSGDTSIISTKELIVRAALPRIVRAGDELFAGAVVTQEALGHTPVSLSVDTHNATVSGGRTITDTLDAQRAREIRFPIHVTGGDSVRFVFRGEALAGRPLNDAVEARLAVSPPGRARAHVVTGMLERAGDATLALPDGIDTVQSRVSLQLGVSPLPLVRQFSEALRIYPYYCTEQVSSAGRALLARLQLERATSGTSVLSARDRAQLSTGVATLVGRQRDDGGIGYWSASNWTSAWLTSYALEFLLGARTVGIDVPQGTIDHARDYLASARREFDRVRTTTTWRDSSEWAHEAVAAATMLRRIGAPDELLEHNVWRERDRLGFEDRLLLVANTVARGDSAGALALLDAAWKSAHLEGRRVVLDDSVASRTWLFRSTSRPISLLLATTARLQPRHPLIGALFESLVQAGRSERSRWWNTLDQAAVAEALTAAAETMSLSSERRIAVAGPRGPLSTVTLSQGRADSLALPMMSLTERAGEASALHLSLASASAAPTYFAMTLFEIPLARPVRADDAGIGVERWYEGYDGGKPITEVREGELVRVRLRITAPADREFVVIDDALPAGLEAVDLSLRTSASLPPFPGAPRMRADMDEGPPGQRWLYGSWDSGWWTPWEHKEIRDDRVLYFARQLWKGSYQASYVARATTAGVFVRPPAQAEEMYNPAVHGRSDGGVFTVTRAPR